jgi:hypothetical protein
VSRRALSCDRPDTGIRIGSHRADLVEGERDGTRHFRGRFVAAADPRDRRGDGPDAASRPGSVAPRTSDAWALAGAAVVMACTSFCSTALALLLGKLVDGVQRGTLEGHASDTLYHLAAWYLGFAPARDRGEVRAPNIAT